jgi:uncharacterized membrane protein
VAAQNEALLKRYQLQMEQLMQVKLAMDVHVEDPRLLSLALRFYCLLCEYCVRVARGTGSADDRSGVVGVHMVVVIPCAAIGMLTHGACAAARTARRCPRRRRQRSRRFPSGS